MALCFETVVDKDYREFRNEIDSQVFGLAKWTHLPNRQERPEYQTEQSIKNQIVHFFRDKDKKKLLSLRNDQGRTYFLEACKEGHMTKVLALIQIGGKSVLEQKDPLGNTALHYVLHFANVTRKSNILPWDEEACVASGCNVHPLREASKALSYTANEGEEAATNRAKAWKDGFPYKKEEGGLWENESKNTNIALTLAMRLIAEGLCVNQPNHLGHRPTYFWDKETRSIYQALNAFQQDTRNGVYEDFAWNDDTIKKLRTNKKRFFENANSDIDKLITEAKDKREARQKGDPTKLLAIKTHIAQNNDTKAKLRKRRLDEETVGDEYEIAAESINADVDELPGSATDAFKKPLALARKQTLFIFALIAAFLVGIMFEAQVMLIP